MKSIIDKYRNKIKKQYKNNSYKTKSRILKRIWGNEMEFVGLCYWHVRQNWKCDSAIIG